MELICWDLMSSLQCPFLKFKGKFSNLVFVLISIFFIVSWKFNVIFLICIIFGFGHLVSNGLPLFLVSVGTCVSLVSSILFIHPCFVIIDIELRCWWPCLWSLEDLFHLLTHICIGNSHTLWCVLVLALVVLRFLAPPTFFFIFDIFWSFVMHIGAHNLCCFVFLLLFNALFVWCLGCGNPWCCDPNVVENFVGHFVVSSKTLFVFSCIVVISNIFACVCVYISCYCVRSVRLFWL